MTHNETPGTPVPTAGPQDQPGGPGGQAGQGVGTKNGGKSGKKNDAPWPRHPWLTALWIPGAAVLMPLGGALGAFGAWFILPSLVLAFAGAIGLIYALVSLCQSGPLRGAALVLLIAPLIAVPLISMNAVQSAVLSARGTAHQGTVTDITVSHGKGTSYTCAVHYDHDAPERTHSVRCGSLDTVGEQVSVTEDPGGLVEPEFTASAENPRFDVTMVGLADVTLLTVSAGAATLGALLHLLRKRRNPLAEAAG
ncbi:hypothetical protein ABTZ03_01490 [Kitasatospora sp. NPDC096077]|uniref:hypothetical protein n=1 Tax=Kitasatospora sp. NPDC096077 TaxID=3155544 RepID=UPI003327AF34